MLSKFASLVPGQRQAQGMGQASEFVDDGFLNLSGGVSVGQVEQHRVPGGAFHQRADGGLSLGADN